MIVLISLYALGYFADTNNYIIAIFAIGSVAAMALCFFQLRALNSYAGRIRETENLKQSKKSLMNILNGINAMVYANDPETGELLFVNDSMKKHYNIQGDPVGQRCFEVFQQGIYERCEFCPCHQLDKDPSKIIEWEEHSTLTKRVYRNTDCYIEWFGNKKVHLQSSVEITELIIAKEQAIQASQAKSKFLAVMSHEIRTPMNAILGTTEIQLQNEMLPVSIKEAFYDIYNSGDLLIGIISDILDLSRIEAGKMELYPIKYEVANLINDVVHLNIMRNSKLIEFNLNINENTLATLIGDELRIKQILNNLLSNAYKYTETGNVELSVNIETENVEPGYAALVFGIKDTGQGMTQEQIDVLFTTEYSRFNQEANRSIEGVGLGLNITWRLVQIMNGTISVESKPNEGTNFTVRLPQKTIDSKVLGKKLIESLQDFRISSSFQIKRTQIIREHMPYGKVLIVDDVNSNLYVAKGLMIPYGLSIDAASSGFEAIEKIKAGNEYDVVFMDHMMPKMDGMETVKIIRDMGYKKPIVALTANAVVGQAKIFLESGFDEFISKPIDIRQLNAILNKLIRDKQTPETINEARKQKLNMNSGPQNITPEAAALLSISLLDFKKTLPVIENIFYNIENATAKELQMFTISVHSMKSVLRNIGEVAASELAFALEKAGREHNREAIKSQTKVLLDELHKIVAKIEVKKQEPENADENQSQLREQLLIICQACANYDERPVKVALEILKSTTWKKETQALISKIDEHMLYGDFEEVRRLAVENL
jgi:signal transduction histidine kinase/response regulator RpfG family c-di-GMP phosphodiesterase